MVDDGFADEPLISIYTVLRIETTGDPGDVDGVLWQPLKKGGAVLTVEQWQALVSNVDVVKAAIDRLEGEAE